MSRPGVRTSLSAMSSCVPARLAATRLGGGSGWRSSSGGVWRRGRAPGRGPRRRPLGLDPSRRAPAPTSWSGLWRAWRWRACQGGEQS